MWSADRVIYADCIKVSNRSFSGYPRPALAVDPAVLTVDSGVTKVALWKRDKPPNEGQWALPGVFVLEREGLEGAVRRAIQTKLRLDSVSRIEQLFTWDKIGRDSRGWAVVVAYYGLTSPAYLHAAVDELSNVCLAEVAAPGDSPPTEVVLRASDGTRIRPAFDHAKILTQVIERIRGKLNYSSLALDSLPERFTLRELHRTYEALLGRKLNKDAFRRRVTQAAPIVEGTGTLQADVAHRPAELYTKGPAE